MSGRKTILSGATILKGLAIGVLGLTLVGCGDGEDESSESGAVPVRTVGVTNMVFREELKLQGSLESRNYALVPAKVAATLEKILVSEGDMVEKGAVLCELDDEILKRSVESHEQQLAVAKSGLAVARAEKDRATATESLAAKNYRRFQELAREDAVTRYRLDEAERNAKIAAATLRVAEEQVGLKSAQLEQTRAALEIARRKLDDATVRAPIGGSISIKYRELGEMVDIGQPIFRIDDPSILEISVFAPARNYADVEPGKSEVRTDLPTASEEKLTVSYRSPVADARLRTFEIKAIVDPPPAGVIAGQLVVARIVLEEREGRGVPAEAVIKRGGHDIIFVVEGDRAEKTTVETGLHTDGYIEILSELPANAAVIVRGQNLVEDGGNAKVLEN